MERQESRNFTTGEEIGASARTVIPSVSPSVAPSVEPSVDPSVAPSIAPTVESPAATETLGATPGPRREWRRGLVNNNGAGESLCNVFCCCVCVYAHYIR